MLIMCTNFNVYHALILLRQITFYKDCILGDIIIVFNSKGV